MNSWDGESSSFVRQLALCIATVSSSRYDKHVVNGIFKGGVLCCIVTLGVALRLIPEG